MMRLPGFRYLAPRTAQEAARILKEEGPAARLLAGGTDLLPNMKRRQQVPTTLIGLRRVDGLRQVQAGRGAATLGAGVTLGAVGGLGLEAGYRALHLAAGKVATPHIRATATLGGNLCLDTRCNYYDQNYEWRQAIDFCKKAPGPRGVALPQVSEHGTCWVAPGSPRCWAVSSSDTAPALVALGAEVTLVGPEGERRIPLGQLYQNDGMAYLTKRPEEVLTAIHLPDRTGWRSTYWKLRRRGSFDFPVLGVAGAIRLGAGGAVEELRLVLGAVASCPVEVDTTPLLGAPLSDEAIEGFLDRAVKPAKPLDNTDYHLSWRKKVSRAWVRGALRELRGDDPASLGLLARSAARLLPVAGGV